MSATNPTGDPQDIPSETFPKLTLSAKEELAVCAERLKFHAKKASREEAKVRLDVAVDMIRGAGVYL